jgi:oligopeptide/dipeptide ABC transporter ATP-binding protein
MRTPLLEAREVTKHFPVHDGLFTAKAKQKKVHALDRINLTLRRNEVLGLVGESGSGKSTLARVLTRLIEPTSGTIVFDGVDITALSRSKLRTIRKEMQMVFQDPFASLNPRLKVEDIIREPLDIHRVGTPADRRRRVRELLEVVGLAADAGNRYPHEFSGGQRQRIGIARALALNPKLIVCDEPVSALDVSVQAQILNLLQEIKQEFGLTYIFIAHGLDVVRHISDRVAVMYLGNIVELGDTEQIFTAPSHPYTQALIASIPKLDPTANDDAVELAGEIPSPIDPPPGCRFHTRCRFAAERCRTEAPALLPQPDGRLTACHLVNDTEEKKP